MISSTATHFVGNVEPASYEPFLIGDQPAGDVAWFRRSTVGDRPLAVGIWRVLPGQTPETVPYVFEGHETFHVLEGEVTIAVEGEEPVTLKPGDIASYVEGTVSTWTFSMPFKKSFVVS